MDNGTFVMQEQILDRGKVDYGVLSAEKYTATRRIPVKQGMAAFLEACMHLQKQIPSLGSLRDENEQVYHEQYPEKNSHLGRQHPAAASEAKASYAS